MASTKKVFIKGISYIALANYSGIVISLVITAILARLLPPSDFGTVAVATVFIAFFSLLSDMGIGPAIVQFKELTLWNLKNIFGFTFWLGIILGSLLFLISPFIASFFNNRILINICRILSFQVFFITLNIVPNALLLKEKRFDIIAFRRISIQLFCGIIAIYAAYNGFNIYSLLISPVLGIILEFIVNLYFNRLRMNIFFEIQSIRQIFSYSMYQFLFNFINYFGRNLDKLLIGKYLNLYQLGFYEKSYRLMLLPVQNITGVISPVLHPILSDFQKTPDKIYKAYMKLTQILANIAFPVAVILFFTATELILLIFGNQWGEAIISFKILSVSIALQIPMVTGGTILQSINRTKLLFILGAINVIIAIFGLFLSIYFYSTIEAISVAFVITAFVSFINTFAAIAYAFRENILRILRIFYLPLLCYCIQFVVLYLVSIYIITTDSLWFSFIEKVFVWGIMTLIYFQWFTEYKPYSIINSMVFKLRNKK
jgi:PST family polysaccharide transporter